MRTQGERSENPNKEKACTQNRTHNVTTKPYNVTHLRNAVFTALFIAGFISLYAQQRGKASFYSRRATGARTSSGERIHHDSMTCAHRTHPFGTLLKVKNLSNGKEVVVRVTDRGPFGRGRIIDLSWGAAKELGMLSQGVAAVEITSVKSAVIPFKDDSSEEISKLEFDMIANDYGQANYWKEEKNNSKQKEQKEPKNAAENRDKTSKNRQKPGDVAQKESSAAAKTETEHTSTAQEKAIADKQEPASKMQTNKKQTANKKSTSNNKQTAKKKNKNTAKRKSNSRR